MAWNLGHRHERELSEINITPLTDVMLVLLVIFMVTTPLIMTESFKVKLPKAVSAGAEHGKGVIVAISAGGVLNVNGKSATIEGLGDSIGKEFSSGAEKTVVVKADGSVPHRTVVKVLDAAKLAGADRLSIATVREER